MAIYANLSTITTQTIPLIIIDPATISADQVLQWDTSIGAFIAKEFTIPENSIFDLSKLEFVGELSVEHGGTGLNSIDTGSLLVGGATPNTFSTIPVGLSNNKQILSVQNNTVGWIDITGIKGNTAHITELFEITSVTLIDTLPEESYVSQITVTISEAYNQETLISVSDVNETITFIPSTILTAATPGIYIFKFDEYIITETALLVKILNATQGYGKITVEFNVF